MKAKLYLKMINQEMIDSIKKRRGKTDSRWVVSWPKECCVLDFTLPPSERVDQPLTKGFIMREEKEGGMFWDPRVGAVYKLDEEAYHALLELDRGFSELEVSRRLNVPLKKVKEFTNQLKRIKRSKKTKNK